MLISYNISCLSNNIYNAIFNFRQYYIQIIFIFIYSIEHSSL